MKLKNIVAASTFVVGNMLGMVANATTYYSETTRIVTGTFFAPLTTAIPDTVSTVYLSFNASSITGGVGSWWYVISGTNRSSVPGMVTDQPLGANNRLTVTFTGTGTATSFGFNPRGASFTMTNLIICDSLTDCPGTSGSGASVDLTPNAYALRSVYNIQSAALSAGLSYDCNVFDKQGICLSTGGRYSTTNSPETTTTSGLLIGSYKYDKNIRVGAWIDQNLSTNNADGIKLGNSKPLFGFFGAWAERTDGLGYEVKVSAGYGEKDITITRDLVNEGEAQLKSKGIQTVSSFGIAIDSNWVASPYLGAKYVSIKRGGYAERGVNGLAYDAINQETTSAVAGLSLKGKIDAKTFTVLTVGAEHDFSHNVSQYAAFSSNSTVTSNAFNSNPQKTRPVVSAGVYYDIDKTQRVGLNATHRQEAFQSTATTSALATYTVGF